MEITGKQQRPELRGEEVPRRWNLTGKRSPGTLSDSPEMPGTQAVAPSLVGGARASDLTLRTHLLSPWKVWVV